ncbi:hypothetical protein WN943_015600 [Citrus x changshan-huyou]
MRGKAAASGKALWALCIACFLAGTFFRTWPLTFLNNNQQISINYSNHVTKLADEVASDCDHEKNKPLKLIGGKSVDVMEEVLRTHQGTVQNQEVVLDKGIDAEDAEHQDFFSINLIEGYNKLSTKTRMYFSTAFSIWDAEFYVKVDDDVHVNLGMLVNTLANHKSKPRIYIGCMKSEPILYDALCLKGFNMVSWCHCNQDAETIKLLFLDCLMVRLIWRWLYAMIEEGLWIIMPPRRPLQLISWMKSSPRVLKFSVDGCSRGNPDMAATVGVL